MATEAAVPGSAPLPAGVSASSASFEPPSPTQQDPPFGWGVAGPGASANGSPFVYAANQAALGQAVLGGSLVPQMRAGSEVASESPSSLAAAVLGASAPFDAAVASAAAGMQGHVPNGSSPLHSGGYPPASDPLQVQQLLQQQQLLQAQQQQAQQQQAQQQHLQQQQQQQQLHSGARPPRQPVMQTVIDPRTGMPVAVPVPVPQQQPQLGFPGQIGPDGLPFVSAQLSGAPPLPQPLGVQDLAQQQQQQHHQQQLLAQMASSQQMAVSQQLHAQGSGNLPPSLLPPGVLGPPGVAMPASLPSIAELGGPLQMPDSPSRAFQQPVPSTAGGYPMQPASVAMPQVSQAAAMHALQVSQAMLVSQAMASQGVSPAAQVMMFQQQQQQQQQLVQAQAAAQQLAVQQTVQQNAQQAAAQQAAALAQQKQFAHLDPSALNRVAKLAQAAAGCGSQADGSRASSLGSHQGGGTTAGNSLTLGTTSINAGSVAGSLAAAHPQASALLGTSPANSLSGMSAASAAGFGAAPPMQGLPSGSHSAPVLPGGMPGYVPSGLSGQHAALGLPGHLQASAAMLAVPGAIPGAMAGAVPGQVPGTMSGAALGVPGATPGVPGVISGMPGAVPGTIPGAIPGAMPGMPGSVPGMGVSMPYAAGALGMHGLPAAGMHASVPTATPSFPGFAALSNPMLMTGTAGLGMAGVQYSQQPTPSLAMLQPALPELSTVISQFEAAAIHNAGGMATPALLMQAGHAARQHHTHLASQHTAMRLGAMGAVPSAVPGMGVVDPAALVAASAGLAVPGNYAASAGMMHGSQPLPYSAPYAAASAALAASAGLMQPGAPNHTLAAVSAALQQANPMLDPLALSNASLMNALAAQNPLLNPLTASNPLLNMQTLAASHPLSALQASQALSLSHAGGSAGGSRAPSVASSYANNPSPSHAASLVSSMAVHPGHPPMGYMGLVAPKLGKVKVLIRTGGSFQEGAGGPEYVGGDTKLVTLAGDAQFQDVLASVERVAGAASLTSASSLHAAAPALK
mmetsp:Transcript_17251/g.51630  ORF Transcript_17251/g.51630 Transcript_17251/m.51630 type:complete len:1025 (-) Transcript_17251:3-3077(-)